MTLTFNLWLPKSYQFIIDWIWKVVSNSFKMFFTYWPILMNAILAAQSEILRGAPVCDWLLVEWWFFHLWKSREISWAFSLQHVPLMHLGRSSCDAMFLARQLGNKWCIPEWLIYPLYIAILISDWFMLLCIIVTQIIIIDFKLTDNENGQMPSDRAQHAGTDRQRLTQWLMHTSVHKSD